MKKFFVLVVMVSILSFLGGIGGRGVEAGRYYVKILEDIKIVNPYLDLEIEIETNIRKIAEIRFSIGFQKEQSLPFVPSSTSTRYRFTIPSDYLTKSSSDYYVPLRVKIIVLDSKHSWSDPGDVKMVSIPKDLFASLLWIPEEKGVKVIGIKASDMSVWVHKMKRLPKFSAPEKEIERCLFNSFIDCISYPCDSEELEQFIELFKLTTIYMNNPVWKFIGTRYSIYDFILRE